MESSEEEDHFQSIETITPQSKIDSVHQSVTEKGIRKLCCELLDLKNAVENMCGDMRTEYLAFLRISEEAVEMEHELVELKKHISSQGILVQDLMARVCREMDDWQRSSGDVDDAEVVEDPLPKELIDQKSEFLENFDLLLAEYKVDEALEAMDAEERKSPDLNGSVEMSSYKYVFMERKAVLKNQLLRISK